MCVLGGGGGGNCPARLGFSVLFFFKKKTINFLQLVTYDLVTESVEENIVATLRALTRPEAKQSDFISPGTLLPLQCRRREDLDVRIFYIPP